MSQARADVAILGGGPGGYEAALVAAQLGAQVTVVEADGLGGACVLTDCVPSKTLIATSETMGILGGAAKPVGLHHGDLCPELRGDQGGLVAAGATAQYRDVRALAHGSHSVASRRGRRSATIATSAC